MPELSTILCHSFGSPFAHISITKTQCDYISRQNGDIVPTLYSPPSPTFFWVTWTGFAGALITGSFRLRAKRPRRPVGGWVWAVSIAVRGARLLDRRCLGSGLFDSSIGCVARSSFLLLCIAPSLLLFLLWLLL